MSKLPSKVNLLKNVTWYATYLFVFWTFYRFLFQFPDNVTELAIKPAVWLIPLFYFLKKEKAGLASIGVTFKNLFPSIYLSIALGAVFVFEALLTNLLKYGHLNFGANIGAMPLMPSLALSFATAFTEETAFRGYIYSRLQLIFKGEFAANITQAVLWTIIHVPVSLFIYKMDVFTAFVYLFITFFFGIGSAFIFGRTKNVFGSIFLHVLWEWPIILFR